MSDVGRVMLRHIQREGQPAMTTTPRSSVPFAGSRKSAWSATEAIKELILAEGLRPGDPMPTESALCERLGISRSSVREDRKSTRLNSSHVSISYAVFCLKKKTK